MHIVALAWMFVVILMVAAEATSTQGSLLGALITLLLYGLLPLGIVMYLLGTPARRRARQRQEAADEAAAGMAVDGSADVTANVTDASAADGAALGASSNGAAPAVDAPVEVVGRTGGSSAQGDGRGHPTGPAIPAERKEA